MSDIFLFYSSPKYVMMIKRYTPIQHTRKEPVMNKIFSLDGPVFSFLSKIADLCILNILWLTCCIPFITIGAATASAYTITIEMVKGNDVKIIRTFYKGVYDNFKRATIIWLILALSAAFLGYDYYLLSKLGTKAAEMMTYALSCVAVYMAFVIMYIFPILPTYKNTVKNAFRNSLLLPFLNLPYSFILLGLHFVVIYATVHDFNIFMKFGILYWLMLGFGLLFYLASFIFVRIFIRDFPEWKEIMDENSKSS